MAVYVWHYPLDPDFPLSVLDYETNDREARLHWHDYMELVLCLEGTGHFLFGRREVPVEPGDVVVVDYSEPHVAVTDGPGPLRLLLTLFLPELIAPPGCRTFDAEYLSPFTRQAALSNPIRSGTPLAMELATVLGDLSTTWERRQRADRHLLDANLRRALGLLVSEWKPATLEQGLGDADRLEHVRPVLRYVEDHFRENVTLEDVSAFVHVSHSRVRHLFKEVTNVGFKEYLTNVRLAEARRLLLGTDVNVCDVARMVGYTNIHQFYKVFYRYSTMSPADYRRYYTLGVAGPGIASRPRSSRGGYDDVDAFDVPAGVDAPLSVPIAS